MCMCGKGSRARVPGAWEGVSEKREREKRLLGGGGAPADPERKKKKLHTPPFPALRHPSSASSTRSSARAAAPDSGHLSNAHASQVAMVLWARTPTKAASAAASG